MDRAKLQKMREVGMRVVKTCMTCAHRELASGSWSRCRLHSYEHEKHTGSRALPAHPLFVCDSWEQNPASKELGHLGDYATEPWRSGDPV
jgi:hypothetical protein